MAASHHPIPHPPGHVPPAPSGRSTPRESVTLRATPSPCSFKQAWPPASSCSELTKQQLARLRVRSSQFLRLPRPYHRVRPIRCGQQPPVCGLPPGLPRDETVSMVGFAQQLPLLQSTPLGHRKASPQKSARMPRASGENAPLRAPKSCARAAPLFMPQRRHTHHQATFLLHTALQFHPQFAQAIPTHNSSTHPSSHCRKLISLQLRCCLLAGGGV
jgi:hypothetical protein